MIETASYLGSATVLDRPGRTGWAPVALPGGEQAWARLALPMAYLPCAGDEVLVIAQETERMFVIGVLRTAGAAQLRVAGDLTIAAGGAITLTAGHGLRLCSDTSLEAAAPRMQLRAGRLELLARQLTQRLGSAYLWVTELFQVKSRRIRAVATADYLLKAQRIHVKSDADCSIDGRTIHLG